MKIIEYMAYCNDGFDEFESRVQELINKGWQPLGGMSVNTDETDTEWFYQSLVKYESD